MKKDSVPGTFAVAAILCVVCSVLVSVTAVGLKGFQDANIELDKQKNILSAAGLVSKDATASDIASLFENVEMLAVDLATGEPVDTTVVDPKTYDQFEAINSPEGRVDISKDAPKDERLGSIPYRAKYGVVYLIKKDGKLDQVVLPFYGKGLWSTMKGFVSIDSDADTIRGLTYYDHGETPGLGGEVDKKKFKSQWPGKRAIDAEGNVMIKVVKAGATGDPTSETIIDGLSGATITTNGVNAMVRYWLGPGGFGPFLDKVRKGEIDG